MTKKPAMPVPEVIAAEMTRIVKTASELADLAIEVREGYEDLYDAAFSKTGSGDGTSVNRPGAPLGDPTGDVAVSGLHLRMRWRVKQAAKPLRRIDPKLVQCLKEMKEAWDEQTPEGQERLRLIRELEDEIATSEGA